MEKFSTWRDGATGIAPFLPSTRSVTEIASRTLFSVLGSAVVSLVSLPWTLFALLTYLLIFQHIPGLSQVAARYNVLMSLRVWSLDVIDSGSSSAMSKRSTSSAKQSQSPKSGDLIVSNFLSPIDVLIYGATLSAPPVFAFPADHGLFVVKSTYSAMVHAITPPPHPDRAVMYKNAKSLAEILKSAKSSGSTVVLFAEGTTSNSRSVLPFVNEIPVSLLPYTTTVYPAFIKYTPASVCTPMPFGSLFSWLMSALSEIQRVNARLKFAAPLPPNSASNSDDLSLTNQIADSLAEAGRVPRMGDDMNIQAKRKFYLAYKRGRTRFMQ